MVPDDNQTAADGRGGVLSPDFIVLFIASFLFMGSLYLLLPVLPLYMADVAHATTAQVGVLIGVLTLASLVLRPYIGRKADDIGRKPFLVLGAADFIAASLLYVVARSIWALIPVLVFHGAGIACFHTASLVIVGDIAPRSHRGKSQAWFQSSFNLAVMTAAPLGVFMKNRLDYPAVFIAASIASAASLVLSLFVTERRLAEVSVPESRPEAGERLKLIVLVSVGIFAGTATLGTIEAFIGLFAKSAGISNFALFFTISSAVLIASRLAGGTLIDRIGRRLSTFAALIALGSSMLILAAADSFAVLCIASVVWGLGFAFCSPALSAMLMDNVPSDQLGSAFGIYTAAFEGGIVFGSMVMGPVAAALGFRWAFVTIGLLCLAAGVFFMSTYRALGP